MFVVDTHCDSICTLDSGAECLVNPYNMAAQHLQFAAMFTERPGVSPEEAWAQMCHMRQQLKEQAVRFADRLALCRTVAEACAAVAAGKKAIFLSVEGSCALDGRPERLEALAQEGLRCLSLTWNQNNRYGCANPYNGTAEDTGLSAEGRELVRECCRRNILVDVSHASDATTLDILRTSNLPVLATHSNFRTVCNHPRNLTDEQALAIRDSGGIIGLNLCLSFIGSESIDALFRHLDYGLQLVGEDAIAFGFDTDGLDRYPDELTLQRSLHEQVIAMMAERGYSDALIRKVAGGNTLRMLERVCP